MPFLIAVLDVTRHWGLNYQVPPITVLNNYLDVVHRGRGSVSTEPLGPSFLATGNKASWTPDKDWVKIGVARQMMTGEQKKIPRGEGSHYELLTYLPLWTLFAGNCFSSSGCISREPSPHSPHIVSSHFPTRRVRRDFEGKGVIPAETRFPQPFVGSQKRCVHDTYYATHLEIRSRLLTEKRKRRRKGRFHDTNGRAPSRAQPRFGVPSTAAAPLSILPWQARKRQRGCACIHIENRGTREGVSCEVPRFRGSFPRILQIAGVFPIPRRHNTEGNSIFDEGR
ncbi:uncharacterized protein BDZ83DRAFT_176865 [Colletotrichum acutatum]|uniref:Uncharacterized protein n=1 Tax=Glomerella acutata TaxID=27357 RepID=A0AAD8US49_GLOAC|nr:uncharacterized protein BDZ83DRAFT_176865 [Colletotrichum acutatum]KAK1727807.1 hypothetical protein BDZ83DRAFT_176865 [Colletotrichum acutatum]